MSITVQVNPTVERRLREDAEKKGVSLDQYVASFLENHFSMKRGTNLAVSKQEGELLQQINLDISPETWTEYYRLKEKRQQGKISETELEQLQALTEQIEIANAERLGVLIELSKIRGVALRSLMEELGLNNKNDE
jgi:hypothetical protein